jgi:hypothetical protein
MDLQKFSTSKKSVRIIGGILIFGFILFVFEAGVKVGYHRSEFSGRLGDNYYKTFEGGRRPMLPQDLGEMPGGHGAVGKVVKVELPTFVVATADNVEKIVRIDASTLVREYRNAGTSTDIKLDDSVVVIGSPDEKGEIQAKLIRIIPSMTQTATSTIE